MLIYLLTSEEVEILLIFRFSAILYPFHKTEALNVRAAQQI
jgi:hypothetical protein